MTARRLGLVINPIAGMGGRVGMHGTDGDALAAARARGAEPVTGVRAARAMTRLRAAAGSPPGLSVLTAGGAMGAAVLDRLEMPYEVIHQPAERSTAADTRAAVTALADRAVDLLMLVGGDGTLRDAATTLGTRLVAALGVPSGVKMHSAAFATSPEAAADVASRYLADPEGVGLRTAEVVDHADHGPELFATLQVPAVTGGVQAAKSIARHRDDAVELSELGREIAHGMEPRRLYLLGPGTTVGHVSAALGIVHSPLGVDAIVDGSLLGADLGESELLDLIDRSPACTLVLGVVGGQGFLLGRGNQQLSPAVLTAVGADNVVVLAARSKIAALQPPVLRVDIGEDAAEQPLRGFQRVRVASGHSTVLRIVS
jgi:predicted polyphosphate/ATP-dependent NAD kinase